MTRDHRVFLKDETRTRRHFNKHCAIRFVYPKETSKKYDCEFNRDNGWGVLGKAGFKGVWPVAIDSDWSALQFRRVQHIKSLKRNSWMALTKEGKLRTKKK